MFELFIARRYLRAKRKQVVISVITAISVIGVAAGVMALVIALAINNGFRDTLQRNLLGATAHVSILEKEPGAGIEHWEQLALHLAKIPHVKSAAPALYESGYISGPVTGAGVAIKGVDVRSGAPIADTLKHLKRKATHYFFFVFFKGNKPVRLLSKMLMVTHIACHCN